MFANRVASTLHKYQDLLTSHPHPLVKHQWLSNTIQVLHAANKEFKSNPSAKATPKTMATTEVVSSDDEEVKLAIVTNKGKDKGKSRKEKKATAKAAEQAVVSAPKADKKKKKFDFSKSPPDDKLCNACNRTSLWYCSCSYQKQMMDEFMQHANVKMTNDPANGSGSTHDGGSNHSGGSSYGSRSGYGSGSSYGWWVQLHPHTGAKTTPSDWETPTLDGR
jgi:hypothetical protein